MAKKIEDKNEKETIAFVFLDTKIAGLLITPFGTYCILFYLGLPNAAPILYLAISFIYIFCILRKEKKKTAGNAILLRQLFQFFFL